MKKRILIPIVLSSVLFLGGCSYGSQNTSVPTAIPQSGIPSVSSPKNTENQPAQPGAVSNMITIQNFAFNPTPLTIKTGTTVTWTNKDSVTHTVNSASFNSGNLANGDKFQFTFTSPGTYNYSCGIHPSMQGTIIVQ
ncbi:MAG TPA: cupredoxin family copper-binding protein [Patescibacteria group bacterium]